MHTGTKTDIDPNSAAPLIEVAGLSYRPDGVDVLCDVAFRSTARRIGIIGRNGSGKTSFARMLAGLIPPDAGKVTIAGVDVLRDRRAALGVVGILFQNPDHQIIFPTVAEEIGFGLSQQGLPKSEVARQVEAVLAGFGKTHWHDAAIHQLSQGQRQLVCLMAVLAMQPKVIILDEPFAGLDIPTTRQLTRTLDALSVTLVHITHDPAVVAGYDRVLWLDGGRVEAEGAPDAVLPPFVARMEHLGAGDDLSDLAG